MVGLKSCLSKPPCRAHSAAKAPESDFRFSVITQRGFEIGLRAALARTFVGAILCPLDCRHRSGLTHCTGTVSLFEHCTE